MEKGEKGVEEDASDAVSVGTEGSKKKEPKAKEAVASVGETFGFAFECGPKAKLSFTLGVIGGIGSGLVRLFPFASTPFSFEVGMIVSSFYCH